MLRYWRRVLLGLALSSLTAVAVGCGSEETAKPNAPEWQEAISATGHYAATFPRTPTTRTQPVPDNLESQLTAVDTENTSYILSETALHGKIPNSLDKGVDNCIETLRAAEQAESGGQVVTATVVSRTTGNFEGAETRRVTYRLTGSDPVTIDALMFYRDDAIVQALVVQKGVADSVSADRFLSSLKHHAH
jgi:hypothetical protein